MREGLDCLLAAGYPLGCVTNKAAQFTAAPAAGTWAFCDDFGIVVSGDTLPEKKPDPAPLLHAAAHFGVAPADALMIGDSVSDVKAARAAGFWHRLHELRLQPRPGHPRRPTRMR